MIESAPAVDVDKIAAPPYDLNQSTWRLLRDAIRGVSLDLSTAPCPHVSPRRRPLLNRALTDS